MENRLAILDGLFDGLKFKDACYQERTNTCVVSFLYNPDIYRPDEEHKKVIIAKLKELIGDFVNYDLSYIKCSLDKRAIANYTYTTIKNNFPALAKDFTFDDISVETHNMNVELKLAISPASYDYAVDFNREELVASKLKESFLADFSVSFIKKQDIIEGRSFIEKNAELMSSIKEAEEKTVYELSDVTNIIGNIDENTLATDYTKVTSPINNVAICGEIVSNQRKSYKRKYTRNGKTTEIEKAFYSFSIRNEGKILYCSVFPKQSDEAKGDLLEPGMKVCLFGSFREFNGKLNFTADAIARCEYKKEEIKSGFKPVNEEYHTVFPQEYLDYEQSGLFEEEETKPMQGSFVVFDLETTGLDTSKDEITEIGACKVVNGRIESTFSTFVKPFSGISARITELTGIDDSMVENAPTINYVMPDFYKYCYGSTLVGHNVIGFDMIFIYRMAQKLSYNFDNPLMDTMNMAQAKLPGLKNYKLGTVVDKLGLVLKNAHRAINDAIATAKVFIKLY